MSAAALPDLAGHFGRYGGRFVPEALVRALDELDAAYRSARTDPVFNDRFESLLRDYAGTPSLLYRAERLSDRLGAEILLKREDLNHTGAHKVRNVLGQALLAKRMGKPRVIAETGAGGHGGGDGAGAPGAAGGPGRGGPPPPGPALSPGVGGLKGGEGTRGPGA